MNSIPMCVTNGSGRCRPAGEKSHRLQLDRHPASGAGKVPGVTGVVLAGGASSRMGSNKALLTRQGLSFIEWIHRTLETLFDEVLVVTNSPDQYAFLPCRLVPDLYLEKGALGGIHSGLVHSRKSAIFAVACDMPHLNPDLIRNICNASSCADLVIPRIEHGYEPLHAVYRKGCLPALEELLRSDAATRIVTLLSQVKVREYSPAEVAVLDPGFRSFVNINTPEEYSRLRSEVASLGLDGQAVLNWATLTPAGMPPRSTFS